MNGVEKLIWQETNLQNSSEYWEATEIVEMVTWILGEKFIEISGFPFVIYN